VNEARQDRIALSLGRSGGDEAIRAARGVDPAIIAEQLSVTETFVRRRQRKLGLRKCRNRKSEQHE
jgi:hypothetical protein